MILPPRFLDELRSRLSPSQVIGGEVRLTSKGRGEHMGLCPFHKEKTPSFTVSDDKGFYHCFGCGVHGDIIKFTMEYKKMDFMEAVRTLADRAGLTMPKLEREKDTKPQHDLALVMQKAAQFYESQLVAGVGQPARAYLEKRGIKLATQKEFRLGYAPDTGDALLQHLKREGVDETLMKEAGLILVPDESERRSSYDRFRGRLMFPIQNEKGQVIAFGGRGLSDDAQPKYLNSPETPLFHKGYSLYNLNRAKTPAREAGSLLIVEGYMDVIGLAQAGVVNAVAPLGTAITETQLRLLWKIVKEPTVCLDGDAAGARAMARVAELALSALQAGYSLNFVTLPEGMDPDDVARRGGKEEFLQLASKTTPLAEALWQQYLTGARTDTPETLAALEHQLMKLTARVPDAIVQANYKQFFKDKMWDLRRSGRQQKFSARPQTPPAKATVSIKSRRYQLEHQMVRLLMHYPQLLKDSEVVETLCTLHYEDKETEGFIDGLINGVQHVSLETLETHMADSGWANYLKMLRKTPFSLPEEASTPEEELRHADAYWKYLTACYNYERVCDAYREAVETHFAGDPGKVEAFSREKRAMEAAMIAERKRFEALSDAEV